MEIANSYRVSIVTYDIKDGDKSYTYKEHYSGRKVTDEEIFDEDGQPIFDDELIQKFRALVEGNEPED